jgi:hypothetical protein
MGRNELARRALMSPLTNRGDNSSARSIESLVLLFFVGVATAAAVADP